MRQATARVSMLSIDAVVCGWFRVGDEDVLL